MSYGEGWARVLSNAEERARGSGAHLDVEVVDAVLVEHRGGLLAVLPELDGAEEHLGRHLRHVVAELLLQDGVPAGGQDEELRQHLNSRALHANLDERGYDERREGGRPPTFADARAGFGPVPRRSRASRELRDVAPRTTRGADASARGATFDIRGVR